MKLKKMLSVILCAALTCSLAGCGTSKEDEKNALEKVQEAGVLKVSVSPDFAPYEFEDPSKSGQDTYVGADISMISYIAEQLGVKLEVVPMDFDACLAAVTQGKADCSINAYYPSEERKKTVDFTDAYFDDSKQVVIIQKKNVDKYATADDFAGETVAAQNGSAQDSIVDQYLSDSKKQLVSKVTDGIQMVKSGKAAGIVSQAVVAESVVAGDDTLAIATPTFTYDEAELVIAVDKGEKEFLDKLNEIIKTINDDKLYDEWLVDAQNLASTITE